MVMKVANLAEDVLDLIGWDLGLALEKISEIGRQAVVDFSCPVKGKTAGRARVIRLTRVAEKKVLVVAANQAKREGGD